MDQPHVEIYVSGRFRNERKSIAAVLPQTPKHAVMSAKAAHRGRICVHPAFLRVATAIGSSIEGMNPTFPGRAAGRTSPMRTSESNHQRFETKEDWI
jgi:hypothetical protein